VKSEGWRERQCNNIVVHVLMLTPSDVVGFLKADSDPQFTPPWSSVADTSMSFRTIITPKMARK
jgi:hypothetical protein